MTVNEGKLWNCWIHCYNATFDWQICYYLLKASVQTNEAHKQIKIKSRLQFSFLISKLRGFEF